MPLYQQIIVTFPKLSHQRLVEIFRKHSIKVLESGGVVRCIENHGIRPLPERARAKFATSDGTRYFWDARFVTTTIDASPKCLTEIDRLLRTEDGILRYFTIKSTSASDRCNSKSYKNPYLDVKIFQRKKKN